MEFLERLHACMESKSMSSDSSVHSEKRFDASDFFLVGSRLIAGDDLLLTDDCTTTTTTLTSSICDHVTLCVCHGFDHVITWLAGPSSWNGYSDVVRQYIKAGLQLRRCVFEQFIRWETSSTIHPIFMSALLVRSRRSRTYLSMYWYIEISNQVLDVISCA